MIDGLQVYDEYASLVDTGEVPPKVNSNLFKHNRRSTVAGINNRGVRCIEKDITFICDGSPQKLHTLLQITQDLDRIFFPSYKMLI